MGKKNNGKRSNRQVSKSVPVETQKQEFDSSNKKSKTATASLKVGDVNGNGKTLNEGRSNVLEEEFVKVSSNGWLSETENDDYSHQPVGQWFGHSVVQEAKEFLQAVERRYPTTFEGVRMRSEQIWVPILKHFHVVIKGFIETSLDALVESHITTLHEDLNEFERFGFDLSWAHQRLNMVEMIKCTDDPLSEKLKDLQETLQTLNETLVEKLKEFVEAYDMYKNVQLAYENTHDARNKKVREVAEKFGVEYDRVLKGPLGFDMLPGY